MKDSCPDLLLLEMLHVHTAINYSSTETGGLQAGTRGRELVPGQSLVRICAEQLGGRARCGGVWFLEQWN